MAFPPLFLVRQQNSTTRDRVSSGSQPDETHAVQINKAVNEQTTTPSLEEKEKPHGKLSTSSGDSALTTSETGERSRSRTSSAEQLSSDGRNLPQTMSAKDEMDFSLRRILGIFAVLQFWVKHYARVS